MSNYQKASSNAEKGQKIIDLADKLEPKKYGTLWGTRWFLYNPEYGMSYRKFFISRLISLIIIGILSIGLLIGGIASVVISSGYVKIDATVTEIADYKGYEKYDFSYIYKGVEYTGSGVTTLNEDGSYKISVGQTYSIYAKKDSYQFQSVSKAPGILLIAAGAMCAVFFSLTTTQFVVSSKNKEE